MKRNRFLLPFMLISVWAFAQNAQQYLIPPTVYVGDRATLVIPLAGGSAAGNSDISLDAKHFPLSADIDFHRIIMERRGSGSRLLIEFSAFVPGFLELPAIEINGERFAGLRVQISSILDSGKTGAVLSGPAAPLAIPGTSLLVYGTLCVFVLILLLTFWAAIWGRRRFGGWILKWKRMRLILTMSGIEKRLRRTLLKEGKFRELLGILSAEFRTFLSFFTGENCRSMTAAELSRIEPAALLAFSKTPDSGTSQAENTETPNDGVRKAAAPDEPAELNGVFIGTFFRRCDNLRFSGREIESRDVNAILDDLRRFLKSLYRAGRGNFRRRKEAA